MRAAPPKSREMHSDPTNLISPDPDLLVENTAENTAEGGLCPLKSAIRSELQALGVGVSEVHRLLHSGDLKNAEETLGGIFERLKKSFCPPNPTTCDWVREGNGDADCDLLRSHEPTYLVTVPSLARRSMESCHESLAGSDSSEMDVLNETGEQRQSRSNLLGDLLDQAMRL
jgi:hypothetical protein